MSVIDGRSAVSWNIMEGSRWLDAGGAMNHFETGMDEAERALRQIVLGKASPGVWRLAKKGPKEAGP